MKRMPLICVFLLGMAAALQAQTALPDWSQFRGPNGSGVRETTNLPAELGPQTNVIWKKALATGHSSPVLKGKYIFLTACEEEKLWTICLDRESGNTLWKKEAPRPRIEKLDFRNNPAAPTPAVDEHNVYVFFSDYGLLAYDFEGKELWRFPLGPFNNNYGMGVSPIVTDNKVILVCDQNTDSYILALNTEDGKVAWKTARPEAKSGHSTPIVYSPEGGESQILAPGSFLLTAYSAGTGKKLWWVGGLSFEMKSTPVMQEKVVFINGYASPLNQPENQVKIPSFAESLAKHDANKDGLLTQKELPEEPIYAWVDFADLAGDGFMDADDWSFFQAALASLNGMLAIRLGGSGDMTELNTVWHYRRSVPQLPSPLLYKNVLYMLNDGGNMTTFNPQNGEVLNQGRIRGAGAKFFASPVAADGKVFIISLKGKLSVLKPGGGLETMSQSDLQEECYATPAIGDSRIYIRTVNTLYCFGKTG